MISTNSNSEPAAPLRENPFLQLAHAGSADELVSHLARYNGCLEPLALREIAIVGAGSEGQRLVELCLHHSISIAAVFDDDPKKIGMKAGGISVQPTSAVALVDRRTPIIIASHRVLEATERFRALGFSTVLPFAALQIAAPQHFKPHMFYDGWHEDLYEHRSDYERLRASLADERSRRVLEAVLQFRLLADPVVLAPILEQGRYYRSLYHPAGLFALGEDEVYVDAGAYDGDSVRRFIERVDDHYERILAFEPDPKTFARLKANFADEPRIETINAGLHRSKGALPFQNDASRGAIFTNTGGSNIAVVSLDEVLGGACASFIKMNIEGAEIDALYGARATIQRWMPKLAISVYHRPSDLWQIPRIVEEFSKDYGLYLRQHDGGVIETVLYAIPRHNAHT